VSFDIAKRNRQSGKFNFKLRDWEVEFGHLEDPPPRVPLKNGRPSDPMVIWRRSEGAAKERRPEGGNDG